MSGALKGKKRRGIQMVGSQFSGGCPEKPFGEGKRDWKIGSRKGLTSQPELEKRRMRS